jgi:membrane protease YdiL (CAAX protease family)
MGIIIALFPGFPAEQAQDTGFSPFGTRLDSMLAFLTLVVIAPVAEEVLFRGYLYGKVKRYIPAIWGAVLTSLLFAFVHFQWNVALDVFVLGMFLCGLRSLTGSIWAGVLLHIIKNGIAYFLMMNPMLSALG